MPHLLLREITKSFGGTQALAGVTVAAAGGRIHALLGENGAGKTTLVRIAGGVERPDAGEIVLDGDPVRLRGPADALRRGVGLVHQHFTAVPRLTVAENVALGGRGRLDRERVAALIREIGDDTGLALDPAAPASELPVTAQARLEIVKALARGARILLLDEPTALLAPAEGAELLAALRRIAAQGTAIVLITHKLREALEVADEITVLRAGRRVLHSEAGAASVSALAAAMFGEDASEDTVPTHTASGYRRQDSVDSERDVIVRAEDLAVGDEHGRVRIREATFSLYAGEIVGVAGVEGSGFRELLRAIAGILHPTSGRLDAPRDTGFVPEDRHREALLLDRPLLENVALRGASRLRGIVRWRMVAERTATLLREHDVRAPGPATLARALSGGNQQKLILARELAGDAAAIVAENPTRGLDLQATRAVHARLRAARDRGALVVLYSTDLDELLALADRVLVTHDGLVREVAIDRRLIGEAMLGVH